jgi:hypothetical protein
MSQQMHYDDPGRERQQYDPGYRAAYPDPFSGSSGQKLSFPDVHVGSGGVSAGQRLALAIVSVVMLVPLAGIVFGISLGSGGGFFNLVGALIGLGLICLTIMVINFVFNRGH